ncbi:MAG: phosphotransferase family protein [Arenicellales bacterium]
MELDQGNEASRQRLGKWIASQLGAASVEVASVESLSGGAIQENWLLHCLVESSTESSGRKFVMRTDAAASIDESRSREQEFKLMSAAGSVSVKVPAPLGFCNDPKVIGKAFAMMEYVEGVGLGPKVVKDMQLGGDRRQLTCELGRQLAMIHSIDLEQTELEFIDTSRTNHAQTELLNMRSWLEQKSVFHPILDWGLRWALSHIPSCQEQVFLHRDFRTGNYLVNENGLAAILDWEFAGYGDPMSDLGWFCAECWRFSRPDLEAGGIGTREDFYKSYEEISGRNVNHESVVYWETMAHLRWALIALQQGMRHLSGNEPSLNMAITSRIVDQLELYILRQTGPERWQHKAPMTSTKITPRMQISKAEPAPQDQSRGEDLAAITRTTLQQEVIPGLAPSSRFSGLMVNNALGILERELRLDSILGQAQNNLLQTGSWQQLSECVGQIRGGDCDGSASIYDALLCQGVISAYIYQPAFPTAQELEKAGLLRP